MSRPSGVHSDSPSSPLAAVPSFLLLPPAGGGWAAGLVPVPAAAFPGVVPPLPDLGRLMPARAAAAPARVPEAGADGGGSGRASLAARSSSDASSRASGSSTRRDLDVMARGSNARTGRRPFEPDDVPLAKRGAKWRPFGQNHPTCPKSRTSTNSCAGSRARESGSSPTGFTARRGKRSGPRTQRSTRAHAFTRRR